MRVCTSVPVKARENPRAQRYACAVHNGEASLEQSDTDARIAEKQLKGLREMPEARRLQLAFVLSGEVQRRVWAAVQHAFPQASADELKWRYAEQVYGPEMAERVKRWQR
jgi:hypothetical protein